MSPVTRKNRRTGFVLTVFVMGLFVYSFFVVRFRGKLPEPEGLTPLQKMLRGL